MNPVIGQLMRNGQAVFYAYIDGLYVERNTVAEMDECIRIGDRMLIALRGRRYFANKACPVCLDRACETKSSECGK